MCAAMRRNKVSSTWNGLPRKGRRQTQVRRSSQSKVGTRKFRTDVTGDAVGEVVVEAGIKKLIQDRSFARTFLPGSISPTFVRWNDFWLWKATTAPYKPGCNSALLVTEPARRGACFNCAVSAVCRRFPIAEGIFGFSLPVLLAGSLSMLRDNV